MNKPLHLINTITFAVLTLGTIAIALVYTLNYITETRPKSVLRVTATATAEEVLDSVELSFNIEERSDTLNNVTEADRQNINDTLDQKTTEILNFLVAQDIPEDDVTTNKNIYTQDEFMRPEIQTLPPDGSSSSASNLQTIYGNVFFTVNLQNLEDATSKISNLQDELLSLGATDINTTSASFSTEKQKEVCDRLETEALQKAKDKAKVQVEALGGDKILAKEVESYGFSCNQANNYPIYNSRLEATTLDSSAEIDRPDFRPGQQELNTSVTLKVTYR